MGKMVYIVAVAISGTIEIDSVWWNKKKAQKRKEDIDNNSDGAGVILEQWVNPKILLSTKEYTSSRARRNLVPNLNLVYDNRDFRLLNEKV